MSTGQALGRPVGRYEILRELGRGGMAVVHLARQLDLRRLVALKELAGLHASHPQAARRFLQEAQVAAGLLHPNIVTVFDFFEDGGTPFIAMELIERGSLRRYVGAMTLPQIGGVLDGVLAALAEGERQSIVHRDLKPENLMVTRDGRIKVADYGIAKATSRVQTEGLRTATGMTVGTPGYMAPEQAMGQQVGPWTDLYALGCVAYELVVGELPFADVESPMAVLIRHINEPVPPVRDVAPDVPPALADWIDRLLAKEPAARPASVLIAAEALESLLIDLLGPRWRRFAVLPEPPAQGTPRRSDGQRRSAIVPMPGPYTPPPLDPSPLHRESDSTAGDADKPDSASEFVTFVEPSPVPPPAPGAASAGAPVPQPPSAGAGAGDAPTSQSASTTPASGGAAAPSEAVAATGVGTTPSGTSGGVPAPSLAATVPPRVVPPPLAPAPARSRLKPRRLTVIAAAVAGAAVLAVAAFAVAPARQSVTIIGLDKGVSSDALALRVPVSWQRGDAPSIESFHFRGALALRPVGARTNEDIVAGLAATTAPSLIAPALRKELTGPPPKPLPVRLAAGIAYRYAALRTLSGGPPVTLFALPTSSGVATLMCRGERGSAVAHACDAVAQTMSLRAGRAFSPPPRAAFAGALNAVLIRLSRADSAEAARMRHAKTAAGLARSLGRLAAAYRKAARAAGGIDTAPYEASPLHGVQAALERTVGLYNRLEEAAAHDRRTSYHRLSRSLPDARGRVNGQLERLRELGYTLKAPAAA